MSLRRVDTSVNRAVPEVEAFIRHGDRPAGMIGIVVSRADSASERIGDALLDLHDWSERTDTSTDPADGGGTVYYTDAFELRMFDTIHLELSNVAEVFEDPSMVVFVSRHAGDTGPLLTTHIPGNIGSAEFGGSPGELPEAATGAMKQIYTALRIHAPSGFDVGFECTHHGPSRVGAPCLFVEVGSGPREWDNEDAAQAVARAVLSLSGVHPFSDRTVVGFGGGHYAPRFERILRETGWGVGHVAADWSLDEVDDLSIIEAVFTRSHADVALIDGDHPAVIEQIRNRGHRIVSETWLREVDDVPFDLVDRVETVLGPIDDGTRIGDRRHVDPTAITSCELPSDLVDTLNGNDPARAIEVIRNESVGYRTRDNGNRITGDLVIPDGTSLETVITALIPVLRPHFDAVELTDDALVLTRRAFDPSAAASLGVPEGPLFGRLAAGESVDIDGTRVNPADVTRIQKQDIPLTKT